MTIDLIKATIDGGGGAASPSRYFTFIQFPLALISANLELPKLILTTEMTELPGRQLATTPQIIYGVTRKMPYGVVYNDLPMTFICTNDMGVRGIFDEWQSVISDPTNNYFNYYDNYVGTVYVYKTDEDFNFKYAYIIEEAYPLTVEAQQLDANAGDQYLRLTVQFAYRRWRTFSELVSGGGAFSGDPNKVFNGKGQLELQKPIPNRITPKTPTSPFD